MMDALIGFARWLDNGQGWLPVLFDAVVKATLVLGLAAMAARALGRASAAARHAVWTAAIVGSLTLPALLLWVPQWRLPVLPATIQAFDAPSTDAPPASPHLAGVPAVVDLDATAPQGDAPGGPASFDALPAWARLTPSGMLLAVWAGVAGILLLRLAIGHSSVRRIARTRKDQVRWLDVARGIVAEAGVTPVPAFVEGPADAMPMTWGILRPVVMLPSNHVSWPAGRLRVVLLHELAHVARRDCLTQLLANLGCALYWFNPLSWLAASRLASERERACDEWVVAAGTDGPEYAEQLLGIARAMRPAGLSWSGVSMARRSQLEGRLLAILDPRQSRRPSTRVVAGATVAAIAIAVPILAAVRPAAAPVVPDLGPASQEAAAPMPMPSPAPSPSPRSRAAAIPAIELPVDVEEAVAGGVAGGIAQATGRGQKQRTPADPKVVAALTLALKDTDQDVREQALFALARLGDVRTAGAIAPMLSDSSPEVREHAALALGQLRDPSTVEPLLGALRDEAPSVREQAAFALAQVRDPRAVEPLIAALGDANAGVREQACFALAQLRDKRATPMLTAALKDSDKDVREQAAFALSQVRDPASAPALAASLQDADAGVREQAVFALSQLRDPRAVEPLVQALGDQAADVQAQAAFALGQSRDRRAVAPLIRALESSSPDVRAQAAWALGQLRDPSATDALMAAIKDASPEVRKAAAFALSQLTEP